MNWNLCIWHCATLRLVRYFPCDPIICSSTAFHSVVLTKDTTGLLMFWNVTCFSYIRQTKGLKAWAVDSQRPAFKKKILYIQLSQAAEMFYDNLIKLEKWMNEWVLMWFYSGFCMLRQVRQFDWLDFWKGKTDAKSAALSESVPCW